MLYHLLYPLRDIWFGFNVFKYITFRSAMAAVTAFLLSVLLGERFINRLRSMSLRERAMRDDTPALNSFHGTKAGTPTMGGLFITAALIFSTLMWSNLTNVFVWICAVMTVILGAVGAVDDVAKITKTKRGGLRPRAKFMFEVLIGLILAVLLFKTGWQTARLHFPFFKKLIIDMGFLYLPFVVLVIVGASNAVNLTDGLDGLAAGCVMMVAATYAVLSYVAGNAEVSSYLAIPFVPRAAELTVFCSAMVGAGLGFLWYNAYPATIFMGDTGSLALGGAIGTVAVLIKQEFLLVIVGAIFVAEVLSVILQVFSLKMTGRRIFRMTPLHHHFQLSGMTETKITVRFLIVAFMLALFTLATLKLR